MRRKTEDSRSTSGLLKKPSVDPSRASGRTVECMKSLDICRSCYIELNRRIEARELLLRGSLG
jgi:hypothetical protein